MRLDELPEPEIMCEGRYVRLLKRGQWEYASRANNIGAVVVLAEFEGKMILIDQPRAATGRRCLELPAGLVGDVDRNATIEATAVNELEEETGFTADGIERLGEFYSSAGMLAEAFTLVRAHGVRQIGEGGGDASEDINVHLVAREEIPGFVERKREEGFGIDVKLLVFMNF